MLECETMDDIMAVLEEGETISLEKLSVLECKKMDAIMAVLEEGETISLGKFLVNK